MQVKLDLIPEICPLPTVDHHCCCKGILVPKNAQIATSFTPCSIICVNFLRHTQKCSCQEVQKLYSTKFSHHMHQRQTDQCELITRRSQTLAQRLVFAGTKKSFTWVWKDKLPIKKESTLLPNWYFWTTYLSHESLKKPD